MKKRILIVSIIVILAVFVCVAVIGIYLNFKENGEPQKMIPDYSQVDFSKWENGTLIVNGTVCENAIVRVHPDGYAVIPILRIVKELGGKVTWKNEYTAVIKCNDLKFILNTRENTLIKSGLNYSMFDVLSGKTKGVPYFAYEGDDYIVADEWVAPFLSDINAFKCIDSEQNIVYINTKN